MKNNIFLDGIQNILINIDKPTMFYNTNDNILNINILEKNQRKTMK